MKKKVLSIVLALFMILGLVTTIETPTQAATTSWQDAYANFLKDQNNYSDAGESNFSLRDLDKNGVPELLVWQGHNWKMYTYTNKVTDLGELMGDGVFSSENKNFPGIFLGGMDNGFTWTDYVSLNNSVLKQTKISDTDINVTPEKHTVYDESLYAVSKNINSLPYYELTNFNITDKIINYGKSPASPHPYATALREYYKYVLGNHKKMNDGSTAELTAYLVDINSDKISEMLVVDASYYARLFYFSNGKLCVYDISILNEDVGFSAYNRIVLTNSTREATTYNILSIKNGKVTIENRLTTYRGDNGEIAGYLYNGKKVSEAIYKELIKKYGLSTGYVKFNKRPDQTAQILAMTTTVKATGITLNKTTLTIEKGKTYALKATIAPSNATTKAVTWTSSNTKVATVDKNGNVKAIGKGTATITATATDGSKVKKTCTITVK